MIAGSGAVRKEMSEPGFIEFKITRISREIDRWMLLFFFVFLRATSWLKLELPGFEFFY